MADSGTTPKQVFKSIDPNVAKARFDYDAETGNLIWKPHDRAQTTSRFAGKVAGHIHTCTVGKKYIQVRVNNQLHYAHRIVWVLHNGPIPVGMQIDHIDGDGINNRLSNLRMVSATENKRNMRRMVTNKTGVTGVVGPNHKGIYTAMGWENGKVRRLGGSKDFAKVVALRKQWEAERGYHENHGTDRPL